MGQKCLTVYTKDFDVFSDMYEQVINTSFHTDEEKEIEGIVVSESGEVPVDYVEKMRTKRNVAVMYIKDLDITIMQHGQVFEILMPPNDQPYLS